MLHRDAGPSSVVQGYELESATCSTFVGGGSTPSARVLTSPDPPPFF